MEMCSFFMFFRSRWAIRYVAFSPSNSILSPRAETLGGLAISLTPMAALK
ncbi:MAG: hypothetical protein LBJ16_03070 [Holosporaceae bacterium]|nr:hypothetical protein [Holosporaceae bacterium]